MKPVLVYSCVFIFERKQVHLRRGLPTDNMGSFPSTPFPVRLSNDESSPPEPEWIVWPRRCLGGGKGTEGPGHLFLLSPWPFPPICRVPCVCDVCDAIVGLFLNFHLFPATLTSGQTGPSKEDLGLCDSHDSRVFSWFKCTLG